MKRFYKMIAPIVLVIVSIPENSDATWIFELFGGSVYNVTTPLHIRQSGYDEIKLNARYETEPFDPPLYYDMRIARWKNNCGWEFEFIHQKLFLENEPVEVQNFSITHGYNLFTINRGWKHKVFILHVGAGIVLTHPETTIREKRYSETKGIFHKGYYISGPVIQGAIGKRFNFYRNLYLTIEGKLTGSYTRIPIQGGNAIVPNVAIHGLFGLGYSF